MDDVRRHAVDRLALWLSILTAVLAAASIVLALFALDQAGLASTILACISAGAAFAPIGALIVRRRGNAVGWVLLAIGGGIALSTATLEYAVVSATHSGVLPAWRWVAWISGWSLVLTAGALALLLLLFPTGTLPSRRWRFVLWAGTVGIVGAAIGAALNPVRFHFTESTAVTFQNPAGLDGFGESISVLLAISGTLAVTAGILCIVSLVVRFRRGSSDDRERIKWLAYVAVAGFLFLLVGEVVSSLAGCEVKCGNTVFAVFFAAIALGMPGAVGAAILRHGLYDIEVVIRKTVVVAAIAVFFVLVYALVVGGVGALVQSSSNATLSFVAAALVAVLFQPVLARARRFADHVVYGRRASPYEVLASFSGRMAGQANDVVLVEMARVVGEGTGARLAEVWLRLDGTLHRSAAWPQDAAPRRDAVPAPGTDLPMIEAEAAVPVRHHDELLGALAVSMPASEPATEATERLLSDLAGQAGLVLRNVRLIEELRASRKRLVTAQDEERRRIERNIHDGAQQQLVALMLRLRLAAGTVEKDPAATKLALAELSNATQSALDDLRDLARGIYPPLLADQGLTVALEARAGNRPSQCRSCRRRSGATRRRSRRRSTSARSKRCRTSRSMPTQPRRRHACGTTTVNCPSRSPTTAAGSTRRRPAMAPGSRGWPIACLPSAARWTSRRGRARGRRSPVISPRCNATRPTGVPIGRCVRLLNGCFGTRGTHVKIGRGDARSDVVLRTGDGLASRDRRARLWLARTV